jgi:hypothetical protein
MPLVGERASKYWLSAKPLWKDWCERRAAALTRSVSLFVPGLASPGVAIFTGPYPAPGGYLLQEPLCWCLLAYAGLEIRACASVDEKPDPSIQVAFTAGSGGKRGMD